MEENYNKLVKELGESETIRLIYEFYEQYSTVLLVMEDIKISEMHFFSHYNNHFNGYVLEYGSLQSINKRVFMVVFGDFDHSPFIEVML